MKLCSLDSCVLPVLARGWCATHYSRWRRWGSVHTTKNVVYSTPEEAFEARTEWQGDCLVWVGGTDKLGYGRIGAAGRTFLTHRWHYERTVGPIADGFYLDHTCHNPPCANPAHLREVKPKQNQENASGLMINNSSGYRGVSWSKGKRKWVVRVQHGGKPHHGGYFADIDKANEAAIALRNKLFTHNDLDRY